MDAGGRPRAQLPTMRTTESGLAPRRACRAIGLKLPMASTSTLAASSTRCIHCTHQNRLGALAENAGKRTPAGRQHDGKL